MAFPYKNLAFEGGGVWGIGFVGSLKVLDDKKILDQIERIAGTSAGSIVAMMVALRYSVAEIETIMNDLNFADFEDKPNIFRVFTKYGYFKGQFALKFLQDRVKEKLGSPDATFKDLKEKGGRDLRVYATNLATRHVKEFSYDKTPNISVALAARASMSIPLFFAAVNLDDEILVDGGAVFAYPITSFDAVHGGLEQTLGLAFDHSLSTPGTAPKVEKFGYKKFFRYFRNMFESLMGAQAAIWSQDKEIQAHTIMIATENIKATQFKLTKEQKQLLFDNGKKAANDFFDKAEQS
ncbi:MAG: patatin-like phospholipase family protein [Bacteroidota bacterium]